MVSIKALRVVTKTWLPGVPGPRPGEWFCDHQTSDFGYHKVGSTVAHGKDSLQDILSKREVRNQQNMFDVLVMSCL